MRVRSVSAPVRFCCVHCHPSIYTGSAPVRSCCGSAGQLESRDPRSIAVNKESTLYFATKDAVYNNPSIHPQLHSGLQQLSPHFPFPGHINQLWQLQKQKEIHVSIQSSKGNLLVIFWSDSFVIRPWISTLFKHVKLYWCRAWMYKVKYDSL